MNGVTEAATVRQPLLTAIVRVMELVDQPAAVDEQCRRILELIAKNGD